MYVKTGVVCCSVMELNALDVWSPLLDGKHDLSQKINLSQVPITALRLRTRKMLSDTLNQEKVLPNEKGCPSDGSVLRDWRGLHELTNLPPLLSVGEDPTMKVLEMWSKEASSQGRTMPSLNDLKNLLGELDRWDVVDDTAELMDGDAEEYLLVSQKPISHVETVDRDADRHILTRDDIPRISCGLPAQNYDAFLLYADEDEDFALQMIKKLEEYGLKLCVKERDMIGGFFEHEAIMRLIAERCNRLIVILSPNFLNSEANTFFVTYAQALGIEQRQRKVVPCLYQPCRIPSQLSHCFFLDYNRSGKLFDFWGKLKDSVRSHVALPSVVPCSVPPSLAVNDFPHQREARVRCTVQEVTDSETSSSGHTALVCLSDPSTLYPPYKGGDNNSLSLSGEWHPSKPSPAVSSDLSSSKPPKPRSSSSTFLRKLLPKDLQVEKVKPKKKWFSRKKALALDNS